VCVCVCVCVGTCGLAKQVRREIVKIVCDPPSTNAPFKHSLPIYAMTRVVKLYEIHDDIRLLRSRVQGLEGSSCSHQVSRVRTCLALRGHKATREW
jgi:hypothetical protein